MINHYYGRDDIRLGAFKGAFGDYIGGNYIDDLVDNFDSPIKHYDQVEDAVSVLRQTLAEAEVVTQPPHTSDSLHVRITLLLSPRWDSS